MEKWKALEQQLNPDSPPSSLDVYVRPPRSCAEDIVEELRDLPGARSKFLLIGARGGGKSTELRRIADLLDGSYLTFTIDLDRSGVSALNVSAFDLLYLSGLALMRGLDDRSGSALFNELVQAYADPSSDEAKLLGDKKTALEGLAGFFEKAGDTLAAASTSVGVISQVGAPTGLAAAGAAMAGSRAIATGVRLLGSRQGSISESSPRGQALQKACTHIVNAVRSASKDRPVCVVIDGLERMNGQAGMRFREIFESTRLLANAPWSYVIAAPPCTMTQTYSVDGTLGYHTRTVWGFPPVSHHEPSHELVQLMNNRLVQAGIDPLTEVETDALETLALRSGGLPRSAISILRRASRDLRRSKRTQLTRAHILEASLDEGESLGRGLDEHRLHLLQEVHRRSVLPSDDEAPTLFADGRIVAYPPERRGGLVVFRVHPLLVTAVDEYRERIAREKSLRERCLASPRRDSRRRSWRWLRARPSLPAIPHRAGHC